jgi:hypothetical protein
MSNYPPQDPRNRGQVPPQGDQYPPPTPHQNFPPPPGSGTPNQPPRGNTGPLQPMQPPPNLGYNPPPTSQRIPPSNMGPRQPRQLGGRDEEGGGAFMGSFHERRIEYLAWGTVVLLAGFAIIMLAVDTEASIDILRIVAPLLAGSILLASGLLQRIAFGYAVSPLTWGTAIFGVAFGLTQLMAELTGQEDVTTQVLYFTGLMVIISGMVIILQVFRKPTRDEEF